MGEIKTNSREMKRWASILCALALIIGSRATAYAEKLEEESAVAAYAEEKNIGEKAETESDAMGRNIKREEDPAGAYAFRLQPEGNAENYIQLRSPAEDYTVKWGESLWTIARSVYGDGGRWKDIAEINALSNPDLIVPDQRLDMPEKEYYLQKPFFQWGKGYYMSDEGAFRFQQPEGWAFATCSLDNHLSTFVGNDRSVRVLWGIEDNTMGEDAWSETWTEVCANVQNTAEAVFGENLEDIFFEKYILESGNEVYNVCCAFRNRSGQLWTVSAAYRFGAKNLMEYIGIGPSSHELDMGKLTLYTAASYEEYEEERHMGFGGEPVVYRGMSVWEYPALHNPFVLAYECVNATAWHQIGEMEEITADYAVEWEEPVLPAVIKKVLRIEGDIMYSDLMQIHSLEAIESIGYDYCSINGERFEIDWKDIPDGDALIKDIAKCKNLYALRIQIGDISDYSLIGELSMLEELEIQAGRTVTDVGFLDSLEHLGKCVLEKAPQQQFVDSLSDRLWKRTCEEEGLTTFKKLYDGEAGLAFDEVEINF